MGMRLSSSVCILELLASALRRHPIEGKRLACERLKESDLTYIVL